MPSKGTPARLRRVRYSPRSRRQLVRISPLTTVESLERRQVFTGTDAGVSLGQTGADSYQVVPFDVNAAPELAAAVTLEHMGLTVPAVDNAVKHNDTEQSHGIPLQTLVDSSGVSSLEVLADPSTPYAGYEELARFNLPAVGVVRDLQGALVAIQEPQDNGIVKIFRIDSAGALQPVHTLTSPDRTYDAPTFGANVLLEDGLIGVGSGNTWVAQPHDGRFYVYDLDSGALLEQTNPEPHAAQYFGSRATSASGFFVVGENGNLGSWNTEAAITVYATHETGIHQVFRDVFISSGAGGSTFKGISATDDWVVGAYWLESEQSMTLYARPVIRDEAGNVTGLGSVIQLTEHSSSNAAHMSEATYAVGGGFAINGRFVAIGQVNGAAQNGKGKVHVLRLGDAGFEHHATLEAPVPQGSESYGKSLAWEGSQLFVSSPNANTTQPGSGAIYVYDLDNPETFSSPVVLNSAHLNPGDSLGEKILVSNGRLLASVADDGFVLFATSQQPPNSAPTELALSPAEVTLPENTDTSEPTLLSMIAIADDGLGLNTITLTGLDADKFEIVGTELFLKAGVALDFEVQPTLHATIQVLDASLPHTSPLAEHFVVNVSDVDDTQESTFQYGFKHVNEPHADDYLISSTNMRRYSEWQNPPITYWGPTQNNLEGELVYKFPLNGPTRSATLYAKSPTWDFFTSDIGLGSGRGVSAIEVSGDGNEWVTLHDNIEPKNWGADWVYDGDLPTDVLGTSELWVRMRFYVESAPNSSYTVAQFGRSTSAAESDVFGLSVRSLATSPSDEHESTLEVIAPATTSTTTNRAISFTDYLGNSITVADSDADSGLLEVLLETDHGSITLNELPADLAITFVQGDGVADSELTLRGTVEDINKALTWVVYHPSTAKQNFHHWAPEEGGNGHWYEFVEAPKTWDDAQATAVSRGGHLATITSAEEQAFLNSFLPHSAGIWLGGFRQHSSDVALPADANWTWVTEEPWEYTDWQPGQPSNATPEPSPASERGRLMTMFDTVNGGREWHNYHGEISFAYVIEHTSLPPDALAENTEDTISIDVRPYGDGTTSPTPHARHDIAITITPTPETPSPIQSPHASSLDTTFGTNGKQTLSLSPGIDSIYDLLLTDTGDMLGVGAANNHFAVYKFDGDLSLDESFGIGGVVELDFGEGVHARAVSVDASGNILAVGGDKVVRLLPNGQLDTSFNVNGWLTTAHVGQCWDIEHRPDGSIAVGGGDDSSFRLAIFARNGDLVAAKEVDLMGSGKDYGRSLVSFEDGAVNLFGIARKSWALHDDRPSWVGLNQTNGLVRWSFLRGQASYDFIHGATVTQRGDVIITGRSDEQHLVFSKIDRVVATTAYYRANPSTDFGDGGHLALKIGTESEGLCVQTAADGTILISGVADVLQQSGINKKVIVVVRLLANGTPDPSFGDNGVRTIEFEDDAFGHTILQTPDGKIVVAGRSGDDIALVRLVGDSHNIPPTLDAIGSRTLNEDAPEQTVFLHGITAGEQEHQDIRITASSSNPSLIPNPELTYSTGDSDGSLTFTPAANQHGTTTITVTVEDAGIDGDFSTTEDNGAFSRTFDITVKPVNDRPILDPSASPKLSSMLADSGTPVGPVGTLVSALIDAGGPHNNFGDVDGDLPGIAITGVNLQGGTLWHSIDDGTTWADVGVVPDALPRLLAANASTRLYFQPAENFVGTISDVITFRAWDRVATGQWLQLGEDIDGEADGDRSGRAVAISYDGSIVAIGASGNDARFPNSGHVRVFSLADSGWQQLGQDIDGLGGAGWSVSLSDDGKTVAVGEPWALGVGQVRIYRLTGNDWLQIGQAIKSNFTNDRFGISVSLSGDGTSIAVGASGADAGGDSSGAVSVFHFKENTWVSIGGKIPGDAATDESGFSVSLSDDGQTVAIGGRWNDYTATNSGNTRVFRFDGTSWQQLGRTFNGEAELDVLGFSVSLSSDGNTVAFGAPNARSTAPHAGRAWVYQWNGETWKILGTPIDGEMGDSRSGHSVSLSSDGLALAIGAPYNDGNGTNAGHARVFDWRDSEWIQRGADIDGEVTEDKFGGSVALSGDGTTLAVGAWLNDGPGPLGADTGHTRVFRSGIIGASVSSATDVVAVEVLSHPDDSTTSHTIPVILTAGGGVVSIDGQLRYDPSKVTVNGFTIDGTLPAESLVLVHEQAPGVAYLGAVLPEELADTGYVLGHINVEIKDVAEHDPASFLTLVDVELNEGILPLRDDDGHVVLRLGNSAPVSLSLASQPVLETAEAGTIVGVIDAIDPDECDRISYEFVGEDGTTDHENFVIDGNVIRTRSPLDYETQESYSLRVRARDIYGDYLDRTFLIRVEDVLESFVVTDFEFNNFGFTVTFNEALSVEQLNLYDSFSTYGAPDLHLFQLNRGALPGGIRTAPNVVRGSAFVSDDGKSLQFIASESLEPDEYVVTLTSGDKAFKSASGRLLDGNADEVAGDDYMTSFATGTMLPITDIWPLPAPEYENGVDTIVGIPSFARSAGEAVSISANGIPLSIQSLVEVVSAAFTIQYNPSLLNINGFSPDQSLPEDTTVAFTDLGLGQIAVEITSSSPLPADRNLLGTISATVPANAKQGERGLLEITNVAINGGRAYGIGAQAIQIINRLGDANGDGIYSGLDVAQIVRIASGQDSGLRDFPLTDPTLIADVSGNGRITAYDGALVVSARSETPMTHLHGPAAPPNGSGTGGGASETMIYRQNGQFGRVDLRPTPAAKTARAQAFLDYARRSARSHSDAISQLAAEAMDSLGEDQDRSKRTGPIFATIPSDIPRN